MRSADRRSLAWQMPRNEREERLILSPAAGAGGAIAARALLTRLLLVKLRRDVRALNAGDCRPIRFGAAVGRAGVPAAAEAAG